MMYMLLYVNSIRCNAMLWHDTTLYIKIYVYLMCKLADKIV